MLVIIFDLVSRMINVNRSNNNAIFIWKVTKQTVTKCLQAQFPFTQSVRFGETITNPQWDSLLCTSKWNNAMQFKITLCEKTKWRIQHSDPWQLTRKAPHITTRAHYFVYLSLMLFILQQLLYIIVWKSILNVQKKKIFSGDELSNTLIYESMFP